MFFLRIKFEIKSIKMRKILHIFLLALLLFVGNFPVYFDDWHITLTENPKPEIKSPQPQRGVDAITSKTPPSGAGGLLLFNGKELQTYADLHLYDYHWRQYDPQLGRWHSPDPADQFHGLSGYAYCANNPVMLTDPDGRIVWFVPVIIGAVVGAYGGAAIQQGTLDPSMWKSNWYQGAIVGAFVGAAAGVGFAALGGTSSAMMFTAGGKMTTGWGMAVGATKAMALNAGLQIANMGYRQVGGSNTWLSKAMGMVGGFDSSNDEFSWGSLAAAGASSLLSGGADLLMGERLTSQSSTLFMRKVENALGDGFKDLVTSPFNTAFTDMYDYGRLQTGFDEYVKGGMISFATSSATSFGKAWIKGNIFRHNRWDRMNAGDKTDWLGNKTKSLVGYYNQTSAIRHGAFILNTSDLYSRNEAKGIIKYFKNIKQRGYPSMGTKLGF